MGPAPMRPFNPILVADAYNHGSWMDYSGGWTPGMAPHIIDLPVWALDLGYPIDDQFRPAGVSSSRTTATPTTTTKSSGSTRT